MNEADLLADSLLKISKVSVCFSSEEAKVSENSSFIQLAVNKLHRSLDVNQFKSLAQLKFIESNDDWVNEEVQLKGLKSLPQRDSIKSNGSRRSRYSNAESGCGSEITELSSSQYEDKDLTSKPCCQCCIH